MTPKPLIELKEVYKTYQMGKTQVNALININLQIYPQELIAILGPSGSGKSTLMHIIGSLDRTSKGKVIINDRDISTLNDSELAILRGKTIGFVFQNFNLIPNLSAIENVELPMIFQKVPKNQREKRAKELLNKVGLSHRINHLPNEMSGGERQRVAIARALANNPDIILADEPTGNLDSKTGEEIIKLLVDLSKNEKKTLIVVTHDEELAEKMQRKIRIKDGKIIEEEKI